VIARTLRWVTLLAATLMTTAAWADPPRAPTAAPTATTAAARSTARPAATEAPAADGVVNINSATAEELVRIPGIGPARAAAIVQLRERAHRFNHPEDLLRVRGIGRVGFRRMRPYLALTGETTLASRPGRAPRARPDAVTE
jgi:competence ComEA-like helix-hairpin-helix protein